MRSFDELAGVYGMAKRSVKRWASVGKMNGDPCPLDSPLEMVEWWERNMKQRVPPEIWTAAGPDAVMKLPPAKPISPPIPVPEATDAEIQEAPQDDSNLVPEGRGVEAEVRRLEWLAAKLSVNAHEPGKAKGYLDTVGKMGVLTTKLRDEAEKQRKLLPRDAVESAIHEFHGPIEREIRLLFRSMCDLTGLPATPETEEKWHRLIDSTFARMAGEILS